MSVASARETRPDPQSSSLNKRPVPKRRPLASAPMIQTTGVFRLSRFTQIRYPSFLCSGISRPSRRGTAKPQSSFSAMETIAITGASLERSFDIFHVSPVRFCTSRCNISAAMFPVLTCDFLAVSITAFCRSRSSALAACFPKIMMKIETEMYNICNRERSIILCPCNSTGSRPLVHHCKLTPFILLSSHRDVIRFHHNTVNLWKNIGPNRRY